MKILKPRFAGADELDATRRNIAREFDTTSRLYRALDADRGLSTARPIACYPDLLALVTERAEGTSLAQLLRQSPGAPIFHTVERLSGILRKVGEWLKTFQALDQVDGFVPLDKLRRYLDERLEALTEGRVIDERLRAGLLRYFDLLGGMMPRSELAAVRVHADFTPENVIVGGDRICVLDFTMAKHGARYLDLSHMFMQIELLHAKPWFHRSVIDRLTRSLLEGFEPGLLPDRPLFALLLLQHVVCHLRQALLERTNFRERIYSAYVRHRQVRWLRAHAC